MSHQRRKNEEWNSSLEVINDACSVQIFHQLFYAQMMTCLGESLSHEWQFFMLPRVHCSHCAFIIVFSALKMARLDNNWFSHSSWSELDMLIQLVYLFISPIPVEVLLHDFYKLHPAALPRNSSSLWIWLRESLHLTYLLFQACSHYCNLSIYLSRIPGRYPSYPTHLDLYRFPRRGSASGKTQIRGISLRRSSTRPLKWPWSYNMTQCWVCYIEM